MAPAKAADIAAQNGVVIHTIAVGDPDAASDSRRRSTSPRSRRSPQRPAAPSTAPRTRPASPTIYAEIDALGARQGATTSWRPRTPLAALPAAAFVALVLARLSAQPRSAVRLRRRAASAAGMSALAAFTFLRPLVLLALLPLGGALARCSAAGDGRRCAGGAADRAAPARRAHHRPQRPLAPARARPADRRRDADDARRRRPRLAPGARRPSSPRPRRSSSRSTSRRA